VKRRRICVFTGTRADFGLLRPLIHDIMQDAMLELQLIVTGSHLAPEFGMSCREIEQAGIPIARKIEILDASDTAVGVSRASGLGMIGFGQALDELRPDIVVVLGDRFETLAAAFSALVLGIPVAHLHGGEITEGAIDDSLRHAITKIAALHFVAAEPYRDRVIQMGENPDRVFLVGGLGIDAMLRLPLLDQQEIERRLEFKIDAHTLIATVHPATAGIADPGLECDEMLAALQVRPDVRVIFTLANADTGGRGINERVKAFVARNADRSIWVASLGSQLYFSCLKNVKGVIGNSSSGLLEAPSFGIGTINIGARQKGRLRSNGVIDCAADRRSIGEAITRLFSEEFQNVVASAVNPYGTGGAASKILAVLKTTGLVELRTKSFRDIPVGPERA
jgi:UDP-hydrolysing UDP-N-acetyl-D-glucosamine 2-epimerase